jgi:hypothetical protein
MITYEERKQVPVLSIKGQWGLKFYSQVIMVPAYRLKVASVKLNLWAIPKPLKLSE